MRVVFEIAGDKQIEREILRVGEHAGDATPAFSAIADYMMAETKLQFASEGGHASGGWAPLSAATLRSRGTKGPVRILHRTGALERSLTDRGDSNQLLEVRRDELVFGSTLGYGEYHQTGTSRMPRRRPLEFTETARRNVVKILQRFIMTGEVVT